MLNVRLAGDHQYWKLLITWLSLVMSLVVYFMLSFSHEMSWMRSGTELSQFLKVFLPTFLFEKLQKYNTYTVHDKGCGRKLIGLYRPFPKYVCYVRMAKGSYSTSS